MAVGVYHKSSPGELRVPVVRPNVLGVKASNLEEALLKCPDELKASLDRILLVLQKVISKSPSDDARLDGARLDDARLDCAVALFANAHATSVVTQNRSDVSALVEQSHQVSHSISNPSPRLCGQTTRLMAREAARKGQFETAISLFEQVEQERDPSESTVYESSCSVDPIELALIKLCRSQSDRPNGTEYPCEHYNQQCEVIASALERISLTPSGTHRDIASDLLWLAFNYARYPLVSQLPLYSICQQALTLMVRDRFEEGITELHRLLGAMLLEHGEFQKAGDLFVEALKLPHVSNDSMFRVDFLYAAGQAYGHLGSSGANGYFEKAIKLLDQAAELAEDSLGENAGRFYRTELAEFLLAGWRVDSAKRELLGMDSDELREDPFLSSKYLNLNSMIANFEGDPITAIRQLKLAGTILTSKHSEVFPEVGTGQSASAEEFKRIFNRLDHLSLREAMPLAVSEVELNLTSFDRVDTLAKSLRLDLAQDRSPRTAELLFRLKLASARANRVAESPEEAFEQFAECVNLLSEYPKLRHSINLAEMFLERGLQLVKANRELDAAQAFIDSCKAAEQYQELSYGVRRACHATLSRLYGETHLENAPLRSEHTKLARDIEMRLNAVAALVNVREYLDQKYRIAAAFT